MASGDFEACIEQSSSRCQPSSQACKTGQSSGEALVSAVIEDGTQALGFHTCNPSSPDKPLAQGTSTEGAVHGKLTQSRRTSGTTLAQALDHSQRCISMETAATGVSTTLARGPRSFSRLRTTRIARWLYDKPTLNGNR